MAMKFDPTVNLGAVLQVLTVGGVAMAYVLGVKSEVSSLTRDVQRVNERLTAEVGNLSTAIKSRSDTLSPCSRMMERMDQMDRRITSTEARNDAQEERLGRLCESVIELRATIEPIVRASQQNLPGAPGVRR